MELKYKNIFIFLSIFFSYVTPFLIVLTAVFGYYYLMSLFIIKLLVWVYVVYKLVINDLVFQGKGVLIMFFGTRIIGSQKFKDMISKASAIKWIVTMWEPIDEIENFSLNINKEIIEPDGQINVKVWKREKVNV